MSPPAALFLFTDFGWSVPYVGQLTAAALDAGPHARVISLMHDAPAMRPDLAAYLLPAVCRPLAPGSVIVAVVDPGVGGPREALVVTTADLTFVGPDNGLLSRVPRIERVERVLWRPARLSDSFHGRDLFAPVAARLAAGRPVETRTMPAGDMVGADWPAAPALVIYIDGYGNVMTAIDPGCVREGGRIRVGERPVPYARTFCEVPEGEVFWYLNSQGLVEIAGNRVSAAERLSLALGDKVLLD